MKTLKSMLITIAALLCSTTVGAHDFKVDGIYYNITSSEDLTVEVTYEGYYAAFAVSYSGTVVIPSFVEFGGITYSVTSIGSSAFSDCTSLISITIPNSVTSIGYSTFSYCKNLTDITIPNSVTSIAEYAFKDCTELTAITIPNSVTSIDFFAFDGCTGLSTVTIETQDIVSNSSLSLATYFGAQITKCIIGNDVTSIGSSAFSGCTALTDIIIPNSVTSIGGSAFDGCTSLPVENNIRYADTWAVGVTDNTLGKYILRENTTGLAGTFSGCTSLARVTLPDCLMYVSDNAFYDCSTLKSLELPETVTHIGKSAFHNCTSLSGINIPSGVTSIGEYAFYNCALTEIVIPKGVTEIMRCSFERNNFSTVEIPEGVTSIGSCAFGSCSNLKFVSLPNSLTSIDGYAFEYSSLLSSITIPESVTSIGSNAFTNLKSVTLNSPTIFAEGGFADKFGSNVSEYIIGADAEEIKDYAFYNSTALQSITLPETLTEIGEGSFEGCTGLTSIAIPANVATINDYAFAGCTNLSAVICDGETPPTCGTGVFEDVNTTECTLDVPEEAVDVYAETSPWSGFNILGVSTPSEVTLTDGQLFENEENMLVDEITYTRTLNNTAWNALYVPFEIPVSQLMDDYEVAYINGIHSYDDDDNGEIDRMSMEVVKVKSGTLLANHPYLIKARTEEAKQMNITVNNTTLYAAKSTTLDCSSVYTKYEITGIYEKMTESQLAGCYALSGGSWKLLASGSYLNPFRLYLRITSRGNSPVKVSPLAMTRIGIHVQGEESSTSVEELLMQEQPKEEIIYDLMGRRVENPVKGHIYIVNGKKRVY